MKRKVKTQLGMIITIVVIYTILEIYGVTSIHFRYREIVRESLATVNCISEFRSAVNEIDSSVLRMTTTFDIDKQSLAGYISDEIDKCNKIIDEYRELPKNDEETQEFIEFNDYFDSYRSSVNEICNAVEVNNIDKAGRLYTDKFIEIKSELSASSEKMYELADAHHVSNMQGAALQRDLISNITTLLSVIFLVVLIRMDRKRMKTEKDLIQTEEKVVKQKEKINTAVLKDVLTETENRMSFINRFSGENSKIDAGYAYYFIMFNIDDFSSVNSTYGVKSGDLILNSSAKKIMNVFEGSAVYRTGSDEFVVALSTTADAEGYNRVTALIEKARDILNTANQIKTGSLVVSYSVSVVKKTGPCSVDSSVLGPLKESMKQGRMTQPGAVMFTELN